MFKIGDLVYLKKGHGRRMKQRITSITEQHIVLVEIVSLSSGNKMTVPVGDVMAYPEISGVPIVEQPSHPLRRSTDQAA